MSIYDLAKEVTYNPDTGEFTWLASGNGRNSNNIAGTINQAGYRAIHYQYKKYLAHRLAFLIMEGKIPSFVDHINGNRSDNRWINLRSATRSQNGVNGTVSKSATSKYLGVRFRKGRKKPWEVCFRVKGKPTSFGHFPSEEEAMLVAKAKYKEIHGEFSPYERKIDEEI